ncbi:MAG: dehydrogenase, partial [Chloroflexota bacterium]|nr:dehydrogenase [Chloroflexota bacterium]
THRVHYDELTIKGSFHHTPQSVKKALDLLASGVVRAKPLITHQLPLERLEEALLLMKEGRAVKVAILP